MERTCDYDAFYRKQEAGDEIRKSARLSVACSTVRQSRRQQTTSIASQTSSLRPKTLRSKRKLGSKQQKEQKGFLATTTAKEKKNQALPAKLACARSLSLVSGKEGRVFANWHL